MFRRHLLQFGCAIALFSALADADAQNLAIREKPSFDQVEQVARRHFLSIRGFNEDQLLVESEVREFLPQLRQLGWWTFPWRRIPRHSLADNQFIVNLVYVRRPPVQLASRIASPERVYNRMERLSYSPIGRILLLELVQREDFYTAILEDPETLCAESDILSELDVVDAIKQLRLDEPTGRVYTLQQLVDSLRQEYFAVN
ncbi:hypothetical protein LOC68_07020 [Blastopirellula sp. JC732]|uniref:Uncharacterized protein n=1 Tax=Blastopirellula sediminis TaxID=2894196 RepID=A0A9X1MKT7_9BACT|nr:hypothetical protein [Blastopirellula sediminis]MCC9609081.1 hypothetical protein [Blastopirellula sediminis]MCC9628142.1 hypothetical protein [Blastopirellula sediminis]